MFDFDEKNMTIQNTKANYYSNIIRLFQYLNIIRISENYWNIHIDYSNTKIFVRSDKLLVTHRGWRRRRRHFCCWPTRRQVLCTRRCRWYVRAFFISSNLTRRPNIFDVTQFLRPSWPLEQLYLCYSKADMQHNIWGNSNVCPTCQRLRDNQV